MNQIFVIGDSGSLEALDQCGYDSESRLQTLLAAHPDLLAGSQISPESPRRWLFISQEVRVPGEEGGNGRWSLDHLFLDQDGVPTFVEVKRATDPRIRREVVGQMLDYAANAVKYWPVNAIRQFFQQRCEQCKADPDEVIQDFLDADEDVEEFWERVKTNRHAGRVRLLFVADELPLELKRVIEFLNEQMDPAEVLGIEVRQFTNSRMQALVPQVVGMTAEAEQRKKSGGGSRQGGEEAFYSRLQGLDPDERRIAEDLLEWVREQGMAIKFGSAARPILEHGGTEHFAFDVRIVSSHYRKPEIRIYFAEIKKKPPMNDLSKRQKMAHLLNSIESVALPEKGEVTGVPNIHLSVLARNGNLERFKEAFQWYLGEVRATR